MSDPAAPPPVTHPFLALMVEKAQQLYEGYRAALGPGLIPPWSEAAAEDALASLEAAIAQNRAGNFIAETAHENRAAAQAQALAVRRRAQA